MPKINLIKRQTITIDEFRSWLHQLIQDKKGALPDLNDWKVIKNQLDKVDKRSTSDETGYSIIQNDDDEYPFACGGAEPYEMQLTLDLLDQLHIERESEYDPGALIRDGVFNDYYHEYLENIKTTYKEYDDGETKTESCREASTTRI